jgi:hypothetical protein
MSHLNVPVLDEKAACGNMRAVSRAPDRIVNCELCRVGGAGGSAHHRSKALNAGLSGMARGTRCLPFVSPHPTKQMLGQLNISSKPLKRDRHASAQFKSAQPYLTLLQIEEREYNLGVFKIF